jgi:hypothetical protein
MTAALVTTPLVGSTTPRIYTPPLVIHCTGAKPDLQLDREHPLYQVPQECNCGCGLNPQTSWGFSCIDFLENILRWKLMPWQKWLYIHALEKAAPGKLGFRFKTIIVLVSRQNGKCLDTNTPILTTEGWKTLLELEVGDQVYHPDGHPVYVTETHPTRYNHRCYEVTTTDGRALIADAEHLWTVFDRRYPQDGWGTLTTEEILSEGLIRSGRECRWELPRQQMLMTKPIDLPIDPYLLGAWLGDGASNSACLHVGDEDMPEMKRLMIETGAAISSNVRARTCWRMQFNIGQPMRDGFEARCRKLGIWGDKAIPEQYLLAGTEQRMALLQGLMDTDGSISKSGQAEFCSTNFALAEGVLYLARSLGWQATIKTHQARLNGKDCGDKYRVFFSPAPEQSPFRLPRKTARIKERKRRAIRIKSITQVKSRPVRCIKVDRGDGLFLAGRDLMPTHNTRWLQGVGLWRLFMSSLGESNENCPGAKLALIACQNLDYAENILKEAVDTIRHSPALRPELINHKVTNGKHRAILTNDRLWRAATATRKGGRSLTVDIAMLDELREHKTWDAYDAISPTTLVRPYGQVVCTSNAGDEQSEVLRSLRDTAISKITAKEDDADGLFEWSLPPDAPPEDPSYWPMANPSVGFLNSFSVDDLQGRFETMRYKNLPGFLTEYMCQWVDSLEPGVIPVQHWAATTDHTNTSRRADRSLVYAGLDVNYQRSRSFIAIAARRADGLLHIEVIQAARGTDWVVPWLMERKKRFKGIAVQKTGAPASGMVEDLKLMGLPVVEWGPGTEVAGGTGLFYDLICEERLVHRPSPVLDRAASSGIKRDVVDGWVFDRRNSPVDVSPLIACAGAVWLENRPKKGGGVFAWPSEDTIKEWEQAGVALDD